MLVVLTSDLSSEWIDRVSSQLADEAMVVPAEGTDAALAIVRRLSVSVVIANMNPLTTQKLLGYTRMAEAAADAVFVCVAPNEVKEQIRVEELFVPDFWLDPDARPTEIAEMLSAAMQKAGLTAGSAAAPVNPTAAHPVAPIPDQPVSDHEVFRRLMSALAGGRDTDRLLSAYVEAAGELIHCASYCLLWREQDAECLTVKASRGLPPEVVSRGRLLPGDAVASWYHRNCRVLTRDELSDWADAALAADLARELEVFRGRVAVPLMVHGCLDGLLILGEKVIGQPYSSAELETLFVIAGYVGIQLESMQAQAETERTGAYMEQSLLGMRCGVITLGRDQRIVVCNPYAANALQMRRDEVEGADLRCLPSPLGDHLHAAFTSSQAAIHGQKVEIPSLGLCLRVSTSRLLDHDGAPVGSVMVLEDVTAAVSRADQTRQQQRLDMLGQIIQCIAHDIRTPLTAIKTYAQLIDGPRSSQELAGFWHSTVSPELERLDRLINQLVRMVQQPEPNFQLVDLEGVVEEAVKQLSDSDGDKPPLDLQIKTPVPRIVADPTSTREALSYLLRYLQNNGSPVTVLVQREENDSEASVCVRMRTSGSADHVSGDEILDPLYALQQPDADLGPAISRQIVDKQGGRVEARTENGNIEFRIAFPIASRETMSAPEGSKDGKA